MRLRIAIVLALIASLSFPPAAATATPVPTWPSGAFLYHDAAANLTTLVASRLNLAVDGSRPGEWRAWNETPDLWPNFAVGKDAYRLYLLDGSVDAWYTGHGVLGGVAAVGNTSYVANSLNLGDLRAAAARIAADLGVPTTFENSTERVPDPGLPPAERAWSLVAAWDTPLGHPVNFDSMAVTFREADRRAVLVSVMPWYQVSGSPDVGPGDAAAIAVAYVHGRHGAANVTSAADGVAVRNGTSLIYRVLASWPAPGDGTWTQTLWIDATTGAIVDLGAPVLSEGDLGGTAWFGTLLVPTFLVAVTVAVLALALFLRMSAERALDHFTRGRIVGFLQANPGAPLSRVREALGVSNGTLAYHVRVLERTGYVRSVREGRLRMLFPEGIPFQRGSISLSRLQLTVLDLLRAQGAMAQAEIARRLGISRQRLHYNAAILRSLGFVEAREDGKVGLSPVGAETIAEGEGGPGATLRSPVKS